MSDFLNSDQMDTQAHAPLSFARAEVGRSKDSRSGDTSLSRRICPPEKRGVVVVGRQGRLRRAALLSLFYMVMNNSTWRYFRDDHAAVACDVVSSQPADDEAPISLDSTLTCTQPPSLSGPRRTQIRRSGDWHLSHRRCVRRRRGIVAGRRQRRESALLLSLFYMMSNSCIATGRCCCTPDHT